MSIDFVTFQNFHTASALSKGVEGRKAPAVVNAADREALADPGKRYGTDPYDVPLPTPCARPAVALDAALDARRSTRSFAERPISFEQVGAVLKTYRSSGELDTPGESLALRTAASAGGLFPIEVYLVATRVAGLPNGVYHYRPAELAITATQPDGGEVSRALQSLVLDPEQARQAAGALVLTARFDRSTHKYGDRGYRYALIEAGEIAQVLALGAAATGTGMVCHGAFYDSLANRLLGIDGLSESALVVLPFGAL